MRAKNATAAPARAAARRTAPQSEPQGHDSTTLVLRILRDLLAIPDPSFSDVELRRFLHQDLVDLDDVELDRELGRARLRAYLLPVDCDRWVSELVAAACAERDRRRGRL
jgi:hypothetical protein